MKQEIETKSWAKQICAVINYKIETRSKTNDDTLVNNGRKLHKPSDIFIKGKIKRWKVKREREKIHFI